MWNFWCYISAAKILSHRRFWWKPQHMVSTHMLLKLFHLMLYVSVWTDVSVRGSLMHKMLSVPCVVVIQSWASLATVKTAQILQNCLIQCCFTCIFCVQLQKPVKVLLGPLLKRGFWMDAWVPLTGCVQSMFGV